MRPGKVDTLDILASASTFVSFSYFSNYKTIVQLNSNLSNRGVDIKANNKELLLPSKLLIVLFIFYKIMLKTDKISHWSVEYMHGTSATISFIGQFLVTALSAASPPFSPSLAPCLGKLVL